MSKSAFPHWCYASTKRKALRRNDEKRLSFTAGDSARARSADSWSALEERSLVELGVRDEERLLKDWPHTKTIDFWEGGAKFIEQHGFAKRTSK